MTSSSSSRPWCLWSTIVTTISTATQQPQSQASTDSRVSITVTLSEWLLCDIAKPTVVHGVRSGQLPKWVFTFVLWGELHGRCISLLSLWLFFRIWFSYRFVPHCSLNIMQFKRCLVADNQAYIKRQEALSSVSIHIHNSCRTNVFPLSRLSHTVYSHPTEML